MEPRRAAGLRRSLLDWYARHARALPWRATRDPYAIWISEAMLQQTRVQTVEPYWRRFLEALPTVRALAQADEEQVLALWSGLGYYRRARALQAAARRIVERHGGEFPRERADVLALPGVGPYTAGAVLSIAFDAPEPLVDGNVARVFTRLFGIEDELGSSAAQKRLWALAAELVPWGGGAGAWNQALMELGATVCLPREPRCDACPWRARCAARRAGRTSELPRTRPRPAPVDVELCLAWVERDAALLLERRGADGRMAGLWQLPTVEVAGPQGTLSGLFPADWPAAVRIEIGAVLGELRHGITRHRIRARVRAGRLGSALPEGPHGLAWVPRAALGTLGLTGMSRKVLHAPFARPLAVPMRAGNAR